jgi:hypothetical protein
MSSLIELNPYEKHNQSLSELLVKYPELSNLISSEYVNLDKQGKIKIANKINKHIKKHQTEFPDLLLINPYTLEPEWNQYEQNRIDLEKLLIQENLDIVTIFTDINMYREKKLNPESKNKLRKKYNKQVGIFRTKGYPHLLTINNELEYELIEIKDRQPKQLRVCALTGNERDEKTVGFKLSRRQSGFFSSHEEAYYAIRAAIDHRLCKVVPDFNCNISKFNFGTMGCYCLELPFTIINGEGIKFIKSNNKKIYKALIPHGKIPQNDNDPKLFAYYFEINKQILIKIKQLIIHDDSSSVTVIHCNNSQCKYSSEGFIVSKRCKCAICRCGREFCVKCHDMYHGDFPCDLHIDEMSKLYIDQTTKPCPGCDIPVEKNEGCQHMTCERCNIDWCWVCNQTFDKSVRFHSPNDPCQGNPFNS